MRVERLRSLREQRGLTQGEAAKKMGIVRTTYSNYEAGNRDPDLDTIRSIAEFFEVSVDYLLGTETKPKTNETNDDKTTIKLIEEQAKKMGLSPADPVFKKMLSDAFDMLRIARGKDSK